MRISDLLKEKRTLLSFEFFPPKNPDSENILDETVRSLKKYDPDFVSVTYGAGGTTRDRSLYWTLNIKENYGLNVMMHLTCIASSREDIRDISSSLVENRIDNVLALRGDPPKDHPGYRIKDDFLYAYQLVEYLRNINDFSIGVAGYPEGHIEAENIERDIEFLKMKEDSGADFVITQIFFENSYFLDFLDRALGTGIKIPIIPGIMPIVNLKQIQKFTDMCGATVPDRVIRKMEGQSPEDMARVGVEYAVKQCSELLDQGVAGLHFYTLNRNRATECVLDEIEEKLGKLRK